MAQIWHCDQLTAAALVQPQAWEHPYGASAAIKKKKVSKYKHLYEDLYLIRYGGSYIQSKYLIIKQLDIEPYLDDLYYAKDVLIRTIEFSDSKKDIEKMSECYNILEEEIKKIRKETPSLTTLKNRYVDLEMYQREVDY